MGLVEFLLKGFQRKSRKEKVVIGGAVVLGILGGFSLHLDRIYLIYRKKRGSKKESKVSNKSIMDKLLTQPKAQNNQNALKAVSRKSVVTLRKKSISEICKEITVFFEDEELRLMSLPTIRGIIESSTHLSLPFNQDILLEGRKKRRKVFREDAHRYIQAIDDTIRKSQSYLEKNIQRLISELKLSFDEFMNSVVLWTERGFFNQIDKIYSKAHQELSECIESETRIGIPLYKEILKRKLQILSSNRNFVESYLKIAFNDATPPIIINIILNDFIFEEYCLEEEDLIWTSIEMERSEHMDIVALENELEIVISEFSESFATVDSLCRSDNFSN